MSWSTIRKATDDDVSRLQAFEQRFMDRYGVDAFNAVAFERESVEYGYLRSRYMAGIRRALRSGYAEGIAYGYIGFHVS